MSHGPDGISWSPPLFRPRTNGRKRPSAFQYSDPVHKKREFGIVFKKIKSTKSGRCNRGDSPNDKTAIR
jgi:hypothetical protein